MPEKLGGGPVPGYSPQQTINNYKDSEQTTTRRVLRKSWNTSFARGTYNNKGRITTPFRAINNSGDFLSRTQYACGGRTLLTWTVTSVRTTSAICSITVMARVCLRVRATSSSWRIRRIIPSSKNRVP